MLAESVNSDEGKGLSLLSELGDELSKEEEGMTEEGSGNMLRVSKIMSPVVMLG